MPTDKKDVLFTVMILSIPSRIEKYYLPLQQHLEKQIQNGTVEILTLIDNKLMSIGEKRQALLNAARGRWVGFLDDDDMVSDDYIESLTKAMLEKPADVITFDQHCTVNGEEFKVNFELGNPHEPFIPGSKTLIIKRPPYHMCFWHSKIAKNIQFRSSSYGEDFDWISRMLPYVTSETHLNKVLHYYRYSDSTSESIQYARK